MTKAHHDARGRTIDYLRISITDRCNLRCVYCMPEDGVPPCQHQDVLRYEEIERVVRVAASLGISKIRLTGGEPLARRGFVDLVELLARIPGIEDLSMTTNGTLLAPHAQALADAGMGRANISLDSLDPARFRAMTRRGELDDVLRGIEAAQRAGLQPIKINVVMIHGLNDDEAADFARRTVTDGWHVRFIEVMPLGEGAHWENEGYVSSLETRARIESALGPLQRATLNGNGPARYWRVPGAAGTIGFISAISEHFCATCNRLRLTSDGRLMPCLFSDLEVDLRTALRSGANDDALRQLFEQAIDIKPACHHIAEHEIPADHLMSRVGG